jgi:hypothetical protein
MNRNLPICYGNGYGYFCDIELDHFPQKYHISNNHFYVYPIPNRMPLTHTSSEFKNIKKPKIHRINNEDVPKYIYFYLFAIIAACCISIYIIIS